MMPEAYEGRYAAIVLEYMRIADDIAGKIASGALRHGDKLPPEQDTADEYGVAYNTARRAMKELRDRGLIETIWGKGTFVTLQGQRPDA